MMVWGGVSAEEALELGKHEYQEIKETEHREQGGAWEIIIIMQEPLEIWILFIEQ